MVSSGFEVETELTIHLLYYKLKLIEVQVPYGPRPDGSRSKLRTFADGWSVLWKLFNLVDVQAADLLRRGGILLLLLGILAGIPPVYGFILTGKVERFPLAILSVGLSFWPPDRTSWACAFTPSTGGSRNCTT